MPLQDLNEGMKGGDNPPFWNTETPGDGIYGTIVDGGKFQGTKYNPNPNAPKVPDTWDNGDPKYTYYLVLSGTGRFDPQGNDTWTVTLSSHRFTAANEALKAAGKEQEGFKEGGKFGLRYVGMRANKTGTAQYKHHEAIYEPPAVASWGPQQNQPAPYGAPAPTPGQVAQQAAYAPAQPLPQQAPPVNPVAPTSYQGYGAAPQQAPPTQVAAQAWGQAPQASPQQAPAPAPAGPAAAPWPTAQPAAPGAAQPEPQQPPAGPTPWPAPPRQLA